LSSKRRKYLAGKVSMNIENICRHMVHVEIIIALRQFKLHSGKIVNTIISLRNKYRVDRIILGSDFLYYMKNGLKKIGPHIIDDKAIEVQVADVLANTYRRHRKISGDYKIRFLR